MTLQKHREESTAYRTPPSSRSTSSLQDLVLNNSNIEDEPSIWDCETTPMTSRPHSHSQRSPRSSNNNSSPTAPAAGKPRSRSVGQAPLSLNNSAYKLSLDPHAPLSPVCLPYHSVAAPLPHHYHERHQEAASVIQETTLLLPDDTTLRKDEEREKVEQKQHDTTLDTTPPLISILYGCINAVIVLPILMSFGAIIYRDPAFSSYMPVLIKLTLVSGMVHQVCFSTFSSLTFAVGQVQDAGLIFLSGMASYIVQYCHANNGYGDDDDQVVLATATVGLALATALLGCGLVVLGKLKLARYVQMLPTCVVGGYLAYIGWFCGVSGVGIMVGGTSELTLDVVRRNIGFVLPGVLGGAFLYVMVRTLRHMAVLPTCILFELLLFYIVLWAGGTSIAEATDAGWIRKTEPPPPLIETWDYLKLDKVAWGVLPDLILTEISMIFVVALSSSLDVAAIELELNRPLDYDHEIATVGISNIVSGLTGGYTGSYIFSQSIFSLRAGIRSRLAGFVLASCQLTVLLLPFPILAYVPNFFFGSLLSMICVDLVVEWLWEIRHNITTLEYILCLLTFALIQLLGVEYGILAGSCLYVLCRKIGFDVGPLKITTRDDDETEEQEEEADNDDSAENRQQNQNQNSLAHYGTLAIEENHLET